MSRRFSAIHQFHSGASPGDAITNQMFDLQRHLRGLGYPSEIFAEHFDGDLNGLVRHIDSLIPSKDELLLIHHSMGHRRLAQIVDLPNPLVTVFHNITPAQHLDDVGYRHFAHIGRHQLRVLAKRSLLGIADSHYNRREMLLAGFGDVEVIPVRTNYNEYLAVRSSRHIEKDWLFVGRIAPNKQQIELINAFSHYHHHVDKAARLYLVGDHKMRDYVDRVGETIESLGLESHIDAPGKIEAVDLVNRYARAGVFVSLSKHEGFGVPLLEAMAAGVPVVALESSAVVETMGSAGVLISNSDPETVSMAVQRLMNDHGYRDEVIVGQDRRINKLTSFDTTSALQCVIDKISGREFPLRVQVQGPVETSYSLAVLNRETALQLAADDAFEVSVFPTEGPGDYEPRMDDMRRFPDLEDLYLRGTQTPYPDVIIRQMFPPRVKDTTAPITLQYFGWEESLVPQEFARDFNTHVSRVMTMSQFVKDALLQSGVTVPIDVVGVGARRPHISTTLVVEELSHLRGTRLLHISSAFPRKGVDVLLRAYFAEFTDSDDVSLILKTFPNPHNDVSAQLAQLQKEHPSAPHVVWIDREMNDDELGVLYREATVYVHPARGEGFGLPVAEAMLAEVPVIATATSGLADFVDTSTAAVIASRIVPADSHVSVEGSEWFEPDQSELQREMRTLINRDDENIRSQRVRTAKSRIEQEFSWTAVGNRIKASINSARDDSGVINVTHLTTFNSRCGIAEYSSLFHEGLPKTVASSVIADRAVSPINFDTEEDVVRLWQQERQQDIGPLVAALSLSDSDVVHLQYNYGFFSMEDLSELIQQLQGVKPIIVTLHRTKDLDRGHEIVSLRHAADALRRVSAIIVHEQHDIARLAEFGVTGNVFHIPHAAMPFQGVRADRTTVLGDTLRLGTFGFLLPHKGLETSLATLHSLNYRGISTTLTALCALHPDPSSQHTHYRVLDVIERWNLAEHVRLDTAFKTVEEIHSELSNVDILLLPYEQTEESSSGVLAMLLGIGKPIIATDLDIFEGAREALTLLPAPPTTADLTSAVIELTGDPARMRDMGRRAQQRALDISWGAVGRRTLDLYRQVLASS